MLALGDMLRMKMSEATLGLLLVLTSTPIWLAAGCVGRDPIQSGDGGVIRGGVGGGSGAGGGGAACESCPGPAPHSANFLCPDGVTIAGPACTRQADAICRWTIVACPPTCVDNVLCVRGKSWDPKSCACVPDPSTCGPVCDIFCQYGNVLDANGCSTCACKPAPPGMCNRCPGPAPGAPNFLCPDGVTIGGPACQARADGTCGWIIAQCPPTCVDTVLCARGLHWDSKLCKCVPDGGDTCACPSGQVCVQQIGGPAIPIPPVIACVAVDPSCTSGSDCSCLPASNGACKQTDVRSCQCDNGIR